MDRTSVRVLVVATAAALAAAGVAAGQNEFFLYQTPCQVTVTGSLDVTASVTGAASATSTDGASLVTTHPIPSITDLAFRDSAEASANLSLTFDDDCSTTGKSSISGTTDYDFAGDLDDMLFTAGSVRSHADSVTRDMLGGGPGSNASADSEYTVPQVDAIEIFVPFQVAGGDNGVITVTDFELKRSDTGATTGNMVAVWQLFTDLDGNCKIDFPDDQFVAGDPGIVFPNDSFIGPMPSFATPRGNYVLWLTYFNVSDESAASASCAQNARASSEVRDSAKIRLQLN